MLPLCTIKNAAIAQLVERDLAKVEVAGSSPVCRSFILQCYMRCVVNETFFS